VAGTKAYMVSVEEDGGTLQRGRPRRAGGARGSLWQHVDGAGGDGWWREGRVGVTMQAGPGRWMGSVRRAQRWWRARGGSLKTHSKPSTASCSNPRNGRFWRGIPAPPDLAEISLWTTTGTDLTRDRTVPCRN